MAQRHAPLTQSAPQQSAEDEQSAPRMQVLSASNCVVLTPNSAVMKGAAACLGSSWVILTLLL